MDVRFVVTHLSHGSPGSFYRPYEMVKQLTKLGITSNLLTPFTEDVENIKDVSMMRLHVGKNMRISNFAYDALRKVIYHKQLNRFISYDKLLVSLSKKIAASIEKSLEIKPDILQGEQEVAALASIKVGKKLRIPVTVDMHNIWAEELVSTGHLKRESETFRNLMNLEHFIVENADHVIVVNEFMQEYMITNFNADQKKITVLPPGGEILYDNFDKNTEKERSSEKKIVYAGLVNPREHVNLLVHSMPFVYSEYPNARFIIAEKGESINEIKNLCKSLSVKPDFYWFESRNDARNLLKQCYIGTLPSKDDIGRKLGTPLKLLEYMSNGLPVVANDIGSWCNIIKDQKIGILTEDNPKDFADGICELLGDESLYKTMQANMLKLLKEQFSWAIHVKKILLPLYQRLLSE